jgi:hypothetical protein
MIELISDNIDGSSFWLWGWIWLIGISAFVLYVYETHRIARIKKATFLNEPNRAAEDEIRRREQKLKEKRKQEVKAEKQALFRKDNKAVLDGISELLSTCVAPTLEVLRAVKALGGKVNVDPKTLIRVDLETILVSFRDTESLRDDYLTKLWRVVKGQLHISDVRPISEIENEGVRQLGMITYLTEYDNQKGTAFASRAASIYLSIVSAI